MNIKTIIEPFKIKMVEPINFSTPEERKRWLKEAKYNLFLLKSEQVIIDLLTDSGTSAMSDHQWGAMMTGDESYAGAKSWQKFEHEVQDLSGFKYVLPTHQGRAAERILYSVLAEKGKTFISNTHFDTTRANIEFIGSTAIDLPVSQNAKLAEGKHFKGNIDVQKLKEIIRKKGSRNIGAVILTVTNNSCSGQPVSMKNAKDVKKICNESNIPFILDSCRIAENSYFIRHLEKGYDKKTYREIATEMFSLADGCVMSAKKDGIANIGGFLALNDKKTAQLCTNTLIITEGFSTYGGLTGRDMAVIAQGLHEVFNPDYLEYRIKSAEYLGHKLEKLGIPVVKPIGAHAVYVDAAAMFPLIPASQYPGQVLACELYLTGGIRSVEIGSLMFGKYDAKNKLIPARQELVRLALPRRVYTQSHVDYVVEVFEIISKKNRMKKGLKITYEPKFLRHFTSQLQPL